MLKSEELRIGNILAGGVVVRINSEDNRVKLKKIALDEHFYIHLLDAMPEDLTEDWLKDFGLERSGDYWFKDQVYIYDTYTLCPKHDEYALFCYKYNYAERLLVYVHQLQNLYQALTGEELTIKEKV